MSSSAVDPSHQQQQHQHHQQQEPLHHGGEGARGALKHKDHLTDQLTPFVESILDLTVGRFQVVRDDPRTVPAFMAMCYSDIESFLRKVLKHNFSATASTAGSAEGQLRVREDGTLALEEEEKEEAEAEVGRLRNQLNTSSASEMYLRSITVDMIKDVSDKGAEIAMLKGLVERRDALLKDQRVAYVKELLHLREIIRQYRTTGSTELADAMFHAWDQDLAAEQQQEEQNKKLEAVREELKEKFDAEKEQLEKNQAKVVDDLRRQLAQLDLQMQTRQTSSSAIAAATLGTEGEDRECQTEVSVGNTVEAETQTTAKARRPRTGDRGLTLLKMEGSGVDLEALVEEGEDDDDDGGGLPPRHSPVPYHCPQCGFSTSDGLDGGLGTPIASTPTPTPPLSYPTSSTKKPKQPKAVKATRAEGAGGRGGIGGRGKVPGGKGGRKDGGRSVGTPVSDAGTTGSGSFRSGSPGLQRPHSSTSLAVGPGPALPEGLREGAPPGSVSPIHHEEERALSTSVSGERGAGGGGGGGDASSQEGEWSRWPRSSSQAGAPLGKGTATAGGKPRTPSVGASSPQKGGGGKTPGSLSGSVAAGFDGGLVAALAAQEQLRTKAEGENTALKTELTQIRKQLSSVRKQVALKEAECAQLRSLGMGGDEMRLRQEESIAVRKLSAELREKDTFLRAKTEELRRLEEETGRWFANYRKSQPENQAPINFDTVRKLTETVDAAEKSESLYRTLSWDLVAYGVRRRTVLAAQESECEAPAEEKNYPLLRHQEHLVDCVDAQTRVHLHRLRQKRFNAKKKANHLWDTVLYYARSMAHGEEALEAPPFYAMSGIETQKLEGVQTPREGAGHGIPIVDGRGDTLTYTARNAILLAQQQRSSRPMSAPSSSLAAVRARQRSRLHHTAMDQPTEKSPSPRRGGESTGTTAGGGGGGGLALDIPSRHLPVSAQQLKAKRPSSGTRGALRFHPAALRFQNAREQREALVEMMKQDQENIAEERIDQAKRLYQTKGMVGTSMQQQDIVSGIYKFRIVKK